MNWPLEHVCRPLSEAERRPFQDKNRRKRLKVVAAVLPCRGNLSSVLQKLSELIDCPVAQTKGRRPLLDKQNIEAAAVHEWPFPADQSTEIFSETNISIRMSLIWPLEQQHPSPPLRPPFSYANFVANKQDVIREPCSDTHAPKVNDGDALHDNLRNLVRYIRAES
jgi:hypothetical protein